MKQHKTIEEWKTLLQLRQSFQGSNVEFCKKHHLSLKTFYRRRVQLGFNTSDAKLQPKNQDITDSSRAPRFIAVTASLTSPPLPDEHVSFSFNIQTGIFSFPPSLPLTDVVTLIRGLMR